jgi:hypothetical protein
LEEKSMRKINVLNLICALLVAGSPIMAQQQPKMGEFSADVTRTVAGKTTQSKIYVKVDRIRLEATEGGKSSATIMRMDTGVTWILMEKNTYMEMKGSSSKDDPTKDAKAEDTFEIKQIRTETVSGYQCKVMQYTNKKDRSQVLTVWQSDKLNYHLKMEMKNGSELTMTETVSNVKEGKISAALFELPKGYQKLEGFGIPGLNFGG